MSDLLSEASNERLEEAVEDVGDWCPFCDADGSEREDFHRAAQSHALAAGALSREIERRMRRETPDDPPMSKEPPTTGEDKWA